MNTFPDTRPSANQYLTKLRIKKTKGQYLTPTQQRHLELPALFDQIHFFQSEVPDKDLFSQPTRPQHLPSLFKLHNQDTNTTDQIYLLADQTGLFSPTQLNQCFLALQSLVDKPNMCIVVGINNCHSVCLSYNVEISAWQLFDTYNLAKQPCQNLNADALYQSFIRTFAIDGPQQCFDIKIIGTQQNLNLQEALTKIIKHTASVKNLNQVAIETWAENIWYQDDLIGLEKILKLPLSQETLNLELYRFCQTGNIEAICMCIEAGGDINASVFEGHTPLMVACLSPYTFNNPALFQTLLAHKPNLTLKNPQGLSAFELAKQSKHDVAINAIEAYIATSKPEKTQAPFTIFEHKLTTTEDEPLLKKPKA